MTAVSLPMTVPPSRLRLRPYMAFAIIGVRQEASTVPALLARMSFVAVILFVFSRLWDRVLAEAAASTLTGRQLLWYLAVTEWIILSFPYVHLQMEADARSGELAARLPQPVSYVAARFAEGLGGAAVRLVVIGAAAAAFAALLSGGLPEQPGSLLLVAPLAALATLLGLLSVVAIGMSAPRLHDVSPLFWIWQKLAFVLGGLILPFEIYPDVFRRIAVWTPFGAMLNGPGRQVFGIDGPDALLVAAQLVFWIAVLAAAIAVLWPPAVRDIGTHGG